MDVKALFKGIAVVVDDEVNDKNANIGKLLSQIESENIPCLTFDSLPDIESIGHFQNLSFLILDWRLDGLTREEIEGGVSVGSALSNYDASQNIAFISKVKDVCFCPIFIFTNENVDEIKTKLDECNVLSKNIFVFGKKELENEGAFFSQLKTWLEETPSVYVLKRWEKEYLECKNRLFTDFNNMSESWPTIMWKTFDADGVNKSLELGELISRNLESRMIPFEFEDSVLSSNDTASDVSELRSVLEAERFIASSSLHANDIAPGDLFTYEIDVNDENGKVMKDENGDDIKAKRYYLNIRAQCDTIRTSNPELYCIKGRPVDEQSVANSFHQGQITEKTNNAFVAFVNGEFAIEFMFQDLKIVKWKGLKDDRVGRLIAPHLTKIQRKYAGYMQRIALPRIPDEVIPEKDNEQAEAS